jgi:hypothetical protein
MRRTNSKKDGYFPENPAFFGKSDPFSFCFFLIVDIFLHYWQLSEVFG